MPEEVVAIIFLFFVVVYLSFLTHKRYELKKLKQSIPNRKGQIAENSLTVSELDEMINEAVSGATAELRERVEAISSRMDVLDGRLGIPTDIASDVEADRTVGRQQRARS